MCIYVCMCMHISLDVYENPRMFVSINASTNIFLFLLMPV